MTRKIFAAFLIWLMGTMLLAGCGKSKENDISGNLKDKPVAASMQEDNKEKEKENEEQEEEQEQKQEQEQVEEETEPLKKEEEKPQGVPGLLLFRQNDYKWNESSKPEIRHQYTYFMLDGESAGFYGGLASSLEGARDEMLSKREKAWNDDLKKIEENEMITLDESWKVYLRRADEEYLSFVTEFSSEGMYDDGAYTEYTAHSYYVDSGREIPFSDVVANEDAFYDLLTDKMYESIDSKLQEYYSTGINNDKETLKNDLKGYMKTGELTWTLDPFGVTCYLQAYTKAPFAESQTILFSEDYDNKIYNDEFRNGARNEWVIQVPDYAGSYIDLNDSGVPGYVKASEFYDYNEENDDFYLSGLYVSCTGDWKNIPTTMPGGTPFYNAFLIHKDGNTVLLENHDEYDTSFINTYVLARHEVREADSIRGCLEWASQKDYDINGEGYTPVYVLTDPAKIRVLTGNGDYAEDWSPTVINVDIKGNITEPDEGFDIDTEPEQSTE